MGLTATDRSTLTLTLHSTVPLPSGKGQIPRLGLGVCASEECTRSCVSALKAGYRHLDTAQIYNNEREAGDGIRQYLSQNPSAKREDLFVCSKLWETGTPPNSTFSRASAATGVESSLQLLGLEYIDLYLLHTPRPGPKCRYDGYLGLQDMLTAGKVKAIGVSNWAPRHIEELMTHPDIKVLPAVNQVEYHPWNQQKEIYDYCRQKGIVMVAYSPLTQGRRLGDQTIKEIAQKHGKTAAQVVLRWILQKGVVTIPKSDREARIRENADIFDFELDEEDMGKIAKLDEGQKANIGESRITPVWGYVRDTDDQQASGTLSLGNRLLEAHSNNYKLI
jgi:diketogulonate reductase-like aldo/keto reductase